VTDIQAHPEPEFSRYQLSYTPSQAAAITGRSRTRIFQALQRKEITGRKDGKATLIEHSELLRWIHSLPTVGRQPS
jgi:excisionase family DNA binding protein